MSPPRFGESVPTDSDKTAVGIDGLPPTSMLKVARRFLSCLAVGCHSALEGWAVLGKLIAGCTVRTVRVIVSTARLVPLAGAARTVTSPRMRPSLPSSDSLLLSPRAHTCFPPGPFLQRGELSGDIGTESSSENTLCVYGFNPGSWAVALVSSTQSGRSTFLSRCL